MRLRLTSNFELEIRLDLIILPSAKKDEGRNSTLSKVVFPPIKSAGSELVYECPLCFTSKVHEAILRAIFLPQRGTGSVFLPHGGCQPLFASPVPFLAA
jgi:hypothetical protein